MNSTLPSIDPLFIAASSFVSNEFTAVDKDLSCSANFELTDSTVVFWIPSSLIAPVLVDKSVVPLVAHKLSLVFRQFFGWSGSVGEVFFPGSLRPSKVSIYRIVVRSVVVCIIVSISVWKGENPSHKNQSFIPHLLVQYLCARSNLHEHHPRVSKALESLKDCGITAGSKRGG